jgi:hypothetical protein
MAAVYLSNSWERMAGRNDSTASAMEFGRLRNTIRLIPKQKEMVPKPKRYEPLAVHSQGKLSRIMMRQ